MSGEPRRQAIATVIIMAVVMVIGGLATWFTATGFTDQRAAVLIAATVAGLIVDSLTVLWIWRAGE